MKIKIDAASENLTQYKDVLGKYNFIGSVNEYREEVGVIEIETIKDIFILSKELDRELILNKSDRITIYDSYVE